ncbi:(Fe-S)-binding protein [Sneathiella glossodoripedis]|uniref:(Fe-S)-binding protein n=1 Tax=Sneathiella glossodoripedis TaxID=418853 RepID=UPI000470ADF2|nr:(Fe-S)-binding protein [Sneathiella glossodoripedis]
MSENTEKIEVALFVTCLVDINRPSVGFAAVKLLEQTGCRVVVPDAQTCCGQPAYNSGDRRSTKQIAGDVISAFKGYRYVIAPSGSCAGMIRKHYPELFADDPDMLLEAQDLANRTYELVSFLKDVRNFETNDVHFDQKVTYHDSCSNLREMKVVEQPRELMKNINGLELIEAEDREACCGFGGTFCIKYSEISEEMVDRKIDHLKATGADVISAGDLGCLMNIAGRLYRRGENMKVLHIAEILAGMGDVPGIGEERR